MSFVTEPRKHVAHDIHPSTLMRYEARVCSVCCRYSSGTSKQTVILTLCGALPGMGSQETQKEDARHVFRVCHVSCVHNLIFPGFARRYFVLFNNGLLQYSFEPARPVRDQLSLHNAAISTAPGRKDIHIDSGTATFHIKCLSTSDFDTWMRAFRTFISSGQESKNLLSPRQHHRQASIKLNKYEGVAETMAVTLEQLEESISTLLQELNAKKLTSVRKKSEKDYSKDAVFGIFKKHPQHPVGQHGLATSPSELPPAAQHVLSVLEELKKQHSLLLRSMQAAYARTEDEHHKHRSESAFGRSRHSVATSISDATHEWHDAVEDFESGPEEFIMDIPEHTEEPSSVATNDSSSTLEQLDQSSSDLNEESGEKQPSPQSLKTDARAIVRRTCLPSPVVGDQGSLFAVLKKNIGKDLSTIALPVTFNEPLTLLQATAEEVEYFGLLDEVTRTTNPIEQLSFVAAFAVSGYAHTRHRSGRKGFNPMLAETFEDVRMKFIAEKVRHHPVELAYHAEGEGWELTATSAGRTKFWGKSLEIISEGKAQLRVGDELFTWTKPSSFVRNVVVGTKYLEHCGQLTVQSLTSHYHCVLEFKQNTYWSSSNVVSGPVYSPTGEVVSHIEGKWDDQISQALDSSHFRLLWRMHPFPLDTQDYYGFTAFGITLNEITPDLVGKLPPTDSRYRPDVRALERGDISTAEASKLRLEELQRERRRNKQDRQPRWFKQVGNEWVYAGGYWEARANGWKGEHVEPLW
ncbi:hypothetical protein AGABI2DRAFT_114262 [Agaricus bisporus var. bisporus H97]|uniref:hypothetical protein n=1 Tax=Agaricus bisporus var. bisporus (strain H97 / ATCC MYA-4626 / FGSC 10389) TaxID=936046 RepID=UPI00029F74AE|nr:hypothetical protein AGABI2DRAFT_114262 [Agaricus bisporus var. bisporus H97]EKV51528.1 hypothetical protein AGABI2DRAFT_114262 [Agaricus bisporus var. bisporus H97]